MEARGASAVWRTPERAGAYTVTIEVADVNGAATTARVNIEVNLNGSPDPDLLASIRSVDLIVNRAEQVTAAVREELAA